MVSNATIWDKVAATRMQNVILTFKSVPLAKRDGLINVAIWFAAAGKMILDVEFGNATSDAVSNAAIQNKVGASKDEKCNPCTHSVPPAKWDATKNAAIWFTAAGKI